MNNDREKLIEEVCQKVNDILDQCKNDFADNTSYLLLCEENLVFYLRVLHFLANPNDNEDKVSFAYKKLMKDNSSYFVCKGSLLSISLSKIHWENLLSMLVMQTYPSFERK